MQLHPLRKWTTPTKNAVFALPNTPLQTLSFDTSSSPAHNLSSSHYSVACPLLNPTMPGNISSQSTNPDNAILRVASLHPGENGLWSLSFNKKDKSRAVRNSIKWAFPTIPQHGLGSLHMLPVELVQIILCATDIRTCLAFRQVNRLCREVVSRIPQYRFIATYGLECIRFILHSRIQPAKSLTLPRLTIDTLYSLACETSCVVCGNLGEFVYLLNPSRCCLNCIERSAPSPDNPLAYGPLYTVYVRSLAKAAGISTSKLSKHTHVAATLQRMRFGDTWRGYYSLTPSKRMHLVNYDAAMRALQAPPFADDGGVVDRINEAMKSWKPFRGAYSGDIAAHYVVAPLPFCDTVTKKALVGLGCKGCVIYYRHTSHFTARDRAEALALARRLYTASDFVEHFRTCSTAMRLWEETQQEKGQVYECSRRLWYEGSMLL
jgi:hypothetical protein